LKQSRELGFKGGASTTTGLNPDTLIKIAGKENCDGFLGPNLDFEGPHVTEQEKAFEKNFKIRRLLLHLNFKIVGSKFCIDSKYNIYCNAEIFSNSLNSEYLKRTLVQIVNAISLFHQEVIKKQY